MRVFISSVISKFEIFRDAAARAVTRLDYEVIRAEDLGASATSPQQACLAAVREADLVVLLLGARYGEKQASGLSATHEEYYEARQHRPVIAFVQEGVESEPDQANFIHEVREWETGYLTTGFVTPDELSDALTREIHRHMVSAAAHSVDDKELLTLAKEAIGDASAPSGEPQLVVSFAPGPRQETLRPGELEDESFAREMQQKALFGPNPLFEVEAGTQRDLRNNWLVLSQESSTIEISSAGDLVIRRPALRVDLDSFSLSALIEEDIEEQLTIALHFASSVWERVDPVHRLSRVGIIAALINAAYQTWRTRAEHASSPGFMALSVNRESGAAHLTPGVRVRTEIGQRADELAHDLMVLLRRGFRQ